MSVAFLGVMLSALLCDHCERVLKDKAYRVISEDPKGGILLNMIVCHQCQEKASELGLRTEEFNLDESYMRKIGR